MVTLEQAPAEGSKKGAVYFSEGPTLLCQDMMTFRNSANMCVAAWGRYNLRHKIWTPFSRFASFRSEFCLPGLLINVGELATIIFQTTRTHVADSSDGKDNNFFVGYF